MVWLQKPAPTLALVLLSREDSLRVFDPLLLSTWMGGGIGVEHQYDIIETDNNWLCLYVVKSFDGLVDRVDGSHSGTAPPP